MIKSKDETEEKKDLEQNENADIDETNKEYLKEEDVSSKEDKSSDKKGKDVEEESISKNKNGDSDKKNYTNDLESKSKEDLIELLQEIQKEKNNLKNDLLRERADFINYKKRSLNEKDDLKYFISGNLLSSLLPAMDSFDQLFSQSTEKKMDLDQFIEGVKMIQKQIIGSFQEYGLESVNPEGEEFNPSMMEALNVQESPEVDKETVTAVFQKGYKINGRVIRPARVMVTKPSVKELEEISNNDSKNNHPEEEKLDKNESNDEK